MKTQSIDANSVNVPQLTLACSFTLLKMELVIKDKGWTINTGNEIQSGNVWSLNFIFVRKASLKGNGLRVIEEKEKQKEKTQ